MFDTASRSGSSAITPSRYAVRQALDQEYQRYLVRQNADMRQARHRAGGPPDENPPEHATTDDNGLDPGVDEQASKRPEAVQRDFFGRIISSGGRDCSSSTAHASSTSRVMMQQGKRGALHSKKDREIWVSFHEGFSNAVRKPITLDELLREL